MGGASVLASAVASESEVKTSYGLSENRMRDESVIHKGGNGAILDTLDRISEKKTLTGLEPRQRQVDYLGPPPSKGLG